MDINQGRGHLINVIRNNIRHKNYEQCLVYNNDAKILYADTSEQQESEILRYKPSEEYPLMHRRVSLDNPITGGILSALTAPIKTLFRIDGVKAMTDNSLNETQKTHIQESFERFYGQQDVHEHIFSLIEKYNLIDPNAWLLCLRKEVMDASGTTIERLNFYPLIVTSKQAIDYEFDLNGNPVYLIALREWEVKDIKKKKVKFEEYWMWGIGYSIHAVEIIPDYTHEEDYADMGYEVITIERNKKPYLFYVKTFEFAFLKRVPGNKIGAYEAILYEYDVRELFYQPAVPILKTIIYINNLIAISGVTHVWPERFEYSKPCTHSNEQGQCDGGYYGGIKTEENKCKSCGGRGYDYVPTEQMVKRLPLPPDPAALLELAKLTHYVERPINLVEFLETKWDKLIQFSARILYNQDLIELDTRAPGTATEVKIDYDRQYHKLLPLPEQIINFWELFQLCAAEYYGATQADATMIYPSDLNLRSVDEYIAQHKAAIDAGLTYDISESIQSDILRKQYRGNEDLIQEIKAISRWKPFKDKENASVIAILSSRSNDDFDKIVWENFDAIRNVIMNTYDGNFYKLDYQNQFEAVRLAIDVLRKQDRLVYQSIEQPNDFLIPQFEINEPTQ